MEDEDETLENPTMKALMKQDMDKKASAKFIAWEITETGKSRLATEKVDSSLLAGKLTPVRPI